MKFKVFEGGVGSLVMPKDGLKFYLSFKNLNGVSDTDNDLIINNVQKSVMDGVPCGYFNGSTSFIYTKDTLNTVIPWLNSVNYVTYCGWFYTTNKNKGQEIISCTDGGGFSIGLNSDGNSGYVHIYFMAGNSYLNQNVCPIGKIIQDRWMFICVRYNGTKVEIFLDKEKVFSQNKSGTCNFPSNNNTPLCIGTEAEEFTATQGVSDLFQGYISSVRIYDRALTDDEITLLSREFDNAFLVFDMDAKKGIQDNSSNPCTLENHGVTTSNDCFVFDGNSYITTCQASKLNLGTGDFTIEVVLNLSTGNSNKPYPTILGGKDGWDYGANGLRWNGTHHRNGFAAFLNPGYPLMRSNTTFTPNDNTFITYTVQRRSGVWEQYFDGVKDSTTVSNSQEYNLCHNSGMCIGCSLWDGSNGYHIGLIKSIKIWNKARYQ